MRRFATLLKPAVLFSFLAAAAAMTACGGGGGGSSSGGGGNPIPQSSPTGAPFPQATAVALSQTSSTTATLPAAGAYTESVALPPAPAGATSITAGTSTTPPTGLAAPSASQRTVQSIPGLQVLFYMSLTTSSTITFSGPATFTITLPSTFNSAGLSFSAAVSVNGGTWQEGQASGVLSGSTLTYTVSNVTLTAGTTYVAFYAYTTPTPSPSPTASPTVSPTPTPTASPTASPTPTPTPTPTAAAGAVVLTPSSLSFTATGSANAQSTVATESGYSGTFSSSNGSTPCTGIATIASGPNAGQFTVTPVAAGTCSYTITGAPGSSAPLNVTVTTTSIGGSKQ